MDKNKRIENKLSKTKIKVSTNWQKYREKKEKILNRRIGSMKKVELIEKLRNNTKKIIRNDWGNYKGYKEALQKNAFIDGLTFEKRFSQQFTQSDIYKLKNVNSLEKAMENLFYKKKGRYVLVTLKLKQDDVIQYFSDSFTLEAFERFKEEEKSIYELVLQKLAFNIKYSGFELISIYLRVIYENPKKDKKPNKKGKHKR